MSRVIPNLDDGQEGIGDQNIYTYPPFGISKKRGRRGVYVYSCPNMFMFFIFLVRDFRCETLTKRGVDVYILAADYIPGGSGSRGEVGRPAGSGSYF